APHQAVARVVRVVLQDERGARGREARRRRLLEAGARARRARVGVGARVAVVARAAGGLVGARGIAAVARGQVAVVALLARGDDAVAARGEGAVRVAAVAVDEPAVVALLARIDHAVAARDLVGAGVDARTREPRRAVEVGLAGRDDGRRIAGVDGRRRRREVH